MIQDRQSWVYAEPEETGQARRTYWAMSKMAEWGTIKNRWSICTNAVAVIKVVS